MLSAAVSLICLVNATYLAPASEVKILPSEFNEVKDHHAVLSLRRDLLNASKFLDFEYSEKVNQVNIPVPIISFSNYWFHLIVKDSFIDTSKEPEWTGYRSLDFKNEPVMHQGKIDNLDYVWSSVSGVAAMLVKLKEPFQVFTTKQQAIDFVSDWCKSKLKWSSEYKFQYFGHEYKLESGRSLWFGYLAMISDNELLPPTTDWEHAWMKHILFVTDGKFLFLRFPIAKNNIGGLEKTQTGMVPTKSRFDLVDTDFLPLKPAEAK